MGPLSTVESMRWFRWPSSPESAVANRRSDKRFHGSFVWRVSFQSDELTRLTLSAYASSPRPARVPTRAPPVSLRISNMNGDLLARPREKFVKNSRRSCTFPALPLQLRLMQRINIEIYLRKEICTEMRCMLLTTGKRLLLKWKREQHFSKLDILNYHGKS